MPRLQLIERLSIGLVAVAALIALIWTKQSVALGVAVGGVLTIANFALLRRLMRGIVSSKSQPRKAVLSLILLFKFGLVGGLIYLVMTYLPVDALGLMFGVSLVVLSVFIEGFRSMLGRAAPQSE
jgi:predicted PurR-regulated permease PerM